MGKFLAIFNGAADEADKADLTEQQQTDFMAAWASWAQANEDALVDPGAPLFRKKRINSEGVEEFEDAKVAYVLLEADSHDAAVQMLSEHPHLALVRGNSTEVIECPSVPG